jgi:alpha-beta hydrolase superfamily lysophospholipase
VKFLAFAVAITVVVLVVPQRVTAQANDPEEVMFQTADGVNVYGDLYATDDRGAPIVLLFHQAGSNARAEYGSIVPRLIERGYSVLAVDQRSGGTRLGGVNRTASALGGGSPSYCDAYPDLEAALAFVIANGFDGPHIVWGSSYSGALVIRLAAEHPEQVDAVLAFSPASGDPMGVCKPGPFLESLETPTLALRPASEMENPRVQAQLEQFQELGHATYVAENGVHGSSMLNPERVEGSVEETWTAVEGFLGQVESVMAGD